MISEKNNNFKVMYDLNLSPITYDFGHYLAHAEAVRQLTHKNSLIDLTIRMFTEPAIELDATILATHLTKVCAAKDRLMEAVKEDRNLNWLAFGPWTFFP